MAKFVFHILEAWCPFVPVWFEIVVTSTDNAYSSVIYYSCKTGFTFSDGSTVKRTKCSALKRWVPDFVACEGNNNFCCFGPV